LTAPLAARWQAIRLAVFDVDGVLTDGRLQLAAVPARARTTSAGPSPAVESKSFHVLDGHGIKQIARAGIAVAWISGRDSPAVTARARELGVERVFQGVGDKLPVLESILAALSAAQPAGFDNVLCIGDDLADLPLMRRCAIAATVPHAPAAVKLAADLVTRAPGGCGAARELCDRLLHAIGRHDLLD
jgi:3-deoxy-D-manno-octulosonate 8-phosphate phosphatase (KDO 8-P phosphatase)